MKYFYPCLLLFVAHISFAQQTYVPDDNFENYLETHNASGATVSVGDPVSMGNGIANDNYVITSNINAVTNLSVSFKNIADMTGIEDFVSLTVLYANYNTFTTLNISNLTQLVTLWVQTGSLTVLDVTSNVLLEDLSIPHNDLSEIDLSNNTELRSLQINHNLLTTVDVINNTKLTLLHAHINQITTLNLVANNLLTEILVYGNELTVLGLENGNNSIITTFSTIGNNNLNCINVDDTAYSTANWPNIDPTTSFGENCYGTYVPDDNFEQALIDLGYDTALDNYVLTANINTLTTVDVGSKDIIDITGIEDFVALTELRIYDNNISNIDLSTLVNLEYYVGRDNNISFLDFSNNANLKQVWAQNNNLNSLDVSASTNINTIFCYGNNINNVIIGTQPLLQTVTLYNNALTNIDLSNYPALTDIRLENNNLSFLDIKNGNNANINFFRADGNPNLGCINVDDDAYVGINWQKDSGATYGEHCYDTYVPDDNFEAYLEANSMGNGIANDDYVATSNINTVTTLDVSSQSIADMTGIEDFVSLTELQANYNSFTIIDVSNLSQLVTLKLHTGSLTSLNVTNNVYLENLQIQNNQLSEIDLSNNIELRIFRINNNLLTTLDVVNNVQLSYFHIHNNSITTLDLSNNQLLTNIKVNSNQLTFLNLKNGNNGSVNTIDTTGNSNLTCINVDDAVYSATNWINIDITASFSEHCYDTYVPDDNFEAYLEANSMGNGIANDDYVTMSAINTVTDLDVSSQSIADMTGIEDFSLLQSLKADNNSFTSLQVSSLSQLVSLRVQSGSLTSLDVVANLLLEDLRVQNNQLSTIDLTNNTELRILQINGNNLTAIDVTNNTKLTRLRTYANPITTLDLSQNIEITEIQAYASQLTSLNVNNGNNGIITTFSAYGNSNLTCINVDDAAYSTANWTNIDVTASFSEHCYDTYVPDDNFEAYLEANSMGNGIANDDYVTTGNINTVTNLNVSYLNIVDMTGIEDFTALTHLSCDNNQLMSLDVSTNTALVELVCGGNVLTSLDVSANTDLEILRFVNNQITSIDLSQNISLKNLWSGSNQLTSLDLSNNLQLDDFSCQNNDITTLDLSMLTNLITLYAHNNELTYLNLRNGTNNIISTFDATGNSNLTCINVDDVAYSTANWTNIHSNSSFSEHCYDTYVPDDNFENYLETHDASGNSVTLGDASSMGNGIANDDYVTTSNINTVNGLDVSSQSITNMTGIEDFVSLTVLQANYNSFTIIDVSNLSQLVTLWLQEGSLTSLDVAANLLLEDLRVQNNQLSTINLTNNPELRILQVNDNNLTAIDVTNNTKLTSLKVYYNQITSLDLSNQSLITEIRAANNQLTFLNVKNGNNTNVTNFNTTSNANLGCIQVDNAAYSTTNWTNIDVTASFSEHCYDTYIPDDNFEAYLEANSMGNGIANDDYVTTSNINAVTTLDVSSQSIADMTGIEAFLALNYLECYDNSLSILDLSANTDLYYLDCYGNSLSSLDLSANTDLYYLDCSNNSLINLDLSANTVLDYLECSNNSLTSLDLSTNTVLDNLYCNNNLLTSLDLSANITLEYFSVENNNLSSLNIQNSNNHNMSTFRASSNPNLTCVLVDDTVYSTTNWTDIDVQTSFSDTDCNYVSISPKVVLQGALLNPNIVEENMMRDDLRVLSLLPTTSPYADVLTCNSTVFDVTGNDAIVDWVFVELRDFADNTVITHSKSALLQRDGDVVENDGVSPITIAVPPGSYYIVIKHRNHLGIMTASPIALINATTTVDFTDSNNQITYGTNAQTAFSMPSGVVAMWAGNVGGDTSVKYAGSGNDTNSIKDHVLADIGNSTNSNLHFYTSYDVADINLEGTIRYLGPENDSNTIKDIMLAHPENQNLPSNLFTILEQLPENLINN